MIIRVKEQNAESKRKFKVVDDYEMTMDCIGYCDTLSEVRKLANEWIDETDGECLILYYPLNEETGKYNTKLIKAL